MGWHARPSRKASAVQREWVVQHGGSSRAARANLNRYEAWSDAKRRAKRDKDVAFLHGADGRIQRYKSYRPWVFSG